MTLNIFYAIYVFKFVYFLVLHFILTSFGATQFENDNSTLRYKICRHVYHLAIPPASNKDAMFMQIHFTSKTNI